MCRNKVEQLKNLSQKYKTAKSTNQHTAFLAAVADVGNRELLSSMCLDRRGQMFCSSPHNFSLWKWYGYKDKTQGLAVTCG